MLSEETATSLTLVDQAGKQHVILRNELDELRATGKSLMPDGLEKDLAPQDLANLLANLLAYMASAGPRPKTLAGNQPAVVTPDASNQLLLRASQAEIYGGASSSSRRWETLATGTASRITSGGAYKRLVKSSWTSIWTGHAPMIRQAIRTRSMASRLRCKVSLPERVGGTSTSKPRSVPSRCRQAKATWSFAPRGRSPALPCSTCAACTWYRPLRN